jgi:hypothetical protein
LKAILIKMCGKSNQNIKNDPGSEVRKVAGMGSTNDGKVTQSEVSATIAVTTLNLTQKKDINLLGTFQYDFARQRG